MTQAKRNKIITVSVVSVLLIIAWLCRIQRTGNLLGWIRCTIQCGLLIAWAISVRVRILNPHVRRLLILISTLCTFWTVEVMVKYTILADLNAVMLTRYAWYLYYVPLTLVPLFTLYSALFVGKPEEYQINRKWYLLLIPAFLCMGLVLTNDIHEWAFVLKNGVESIGSDGDYSQNIVFFITMGLSLSEILVFFAILLRKCRLVKKSKRIILPLVPILFLIVYAVVYILSYDTIAVIAGDMKTVNVYAIVLTLELCIEKGLLPSNTHYKELFTASSLSAVITDKNYETYLSSNMQTELFAETMRKTAETSVMLENNIRLSGMPIKDGYILWTEDMTEINRIISEIEELNEDLEGKNLVLQEEYETKRKAQSLVEKNRLYNQMQDQTEDKIIKLQNLIESLQGTENAEEIKRITAEIAVVTAYLKRRNNLIFIEEENGTVAMSEFEYCLKESLNNLRLFGATCDMNIGIEKSLQFKMVTELYNAFETVAETVMDTLKELYVSVVMENELPVIRCNITCETDINCLKEQGFEVSEEDGNEWTTEYTAKGGEQG